MNWEIFSKNIFVAEFSVHERFFRVAGLAQKCGWCLWWNSKLSVRGHRYQFSPHSTPGYPWPAQAATQASPYGGWAMWAYRSLPSCFGPTCWLKVRVQLQDSQRVILTGLRPHPWLTTARFLSLLDSKITCSRLPWHQVRPFPQIFPSSRLCSLSSIMKWSFEGQWYSIKSSGQLHQLDL